MLPEYATLDVKILDIRLERPLGLDVDGPCTLRLAIGHQRYKTHERDLSSLAPFSFSLTLHANLFFILQLDYYLERRGIMFGRRREHVGRAQLRVRLLEGPVAGEPLSEMTGWWELRKRNACFLPLDELGKLPDDPREGAAVGAVRLQLWWKRTWADATLHNFNVISEPALSKEAVENVAKAELVANNGPILNELGAADVSSGTSNTSRSSTPTLPLPPSQFTTPVGDSNAEDNAKVLLGRESIEKAVEEKKVALIVGNRPQFSTSALLFQKMAGALVSGDDYKALLTIQAMLLAFNQGIEVSGMSMTRSFLLLQRYYDMRSYLPPVNHNHVSACKEVFVLPRSLYRYVIASYGWLGVTYTGRGKGLLDAMRSQADIKTVKEFLRLSEGDLLKACFGSKGAFRPCYFVAYDRDLRAIVLSIRATLHANDAITDLVCDYVEWRKPGGFVHSGILAAAQWIFDETFDVIVKAADSLRCQNLYITGHSLGGGTSVLLTMLLLDRLKELDLDKYNVRCASFGSPPVISQNLTDCYQDHIVTFVNNEDVVPRLCYGSAVDLQCVMLYCAQISNDAWMFGNLPSRLCHNLDICRDIISTRSLSVKLCHPGRVYLLSQIGSATHAFPVACNYFREIRISRRFILDHFPDLYEKALDAAYINCMMRELEKGGNRSNLDPLDLEASSSTPPSPSRSANPPKETRSLSL